jgi:hypothetical protein
MSFLCGCRIGRICLHIIAMIGDHQVMWHLAGIRRELLLLH